MASILPAGFTLAAVTDEIAVILGLSPILGLILIRLALRYAPKVIGLLRRI